MARASAVAALALLLLGTAAAQNNETRAESGIGTGVGTTARSEKVLVPGTGSGQAGCVSFDYAPAKTPGFNYTARLGLPTVLPDGCKTTDLQISKMYTFKSCPNTRANNYPVAALGITNTCTDPILTANNDTCNNVISQAPDGALATSGIGQGDTIDEGQTCWNASLVYFFVKNNCASDIDVTIKVYFDTYSGDCTNSADSDDGGDDAGGEAPSSGGGLSSGAKAGIAIGVIGGVAIIAGIIAFFCCCQLRK